MNSQYYEILKNFDSRFYTEGCQVLSGVPQFKADMTALSADYLKHLRRLLGQYEYDKACSLLADISKEIINNHSYMPDQVRRFFCSVCDLFGQNNLNYPQEIHENLFGEIFRIPLLRDIVSLVNDYCFQTGKPKSSLSGGDNHIDRVVEYMAIHYSDRITLPIAAGLAHLSENYFSKLFKKHTGEKFSNYLTNLRINVAKIELSNTNAKIYTIAEDVGFINVGYFTQVFKKTTGYTPEQYRANTLKE
jgi:YesN/AraC family two-component response regulator